MKILSKTNYFLLSVLLLLLFLYSEVYASHKIQVMALFTDKAMISVDGKQKFLKKGETYQGVKLISSDSHGAILELHGEKRKFKLGSTVSTNFKKSTLDKEFVVWKDAYNMFRINGSINNYSAKFLIDTGASSIAMSSRMAKRMGLKFKQGSPIRATTASGVVNGYQVILSKVKIGHIQLYNVNAAVLEGSYPTEVLLGQTFLSRIHMTRDGDKMILKQKY